MQKMSSEIDSCFMKCDFLSCVQKGFCTVEARGLTYVRTCISNGARQKLQATRRPDFQY